MKAEDYKQLDYLLSELESELGCKYCIIPNYIQDGTYVGLYNYKHERYKEIISHSIESCIEKLKTKP